MRGALPRLTLSRAFTYANVLLLGTLCVVLAVAAAKTYEKATERALEQQWTSSGEMTSGTLSHAITTNEFDFVSTFVRRITAEPDVAEFTLYRLDPSAAPGTPVAERPFVRAIDASGRVVFPAEESTGRHEEDALARRSLRVQTALFELPAGDDPHTPSGLAFPVYDGDELWGAGRLSITSHRLNALTVLLYERLALVSALFLGIGIFGGIVLARHVTRPLAKLTDIATRVQAGDLTARCDLQRDDELGDLGRVFDAMIASLRDAQSELSGARSRLESIVESMVDAVVVIEPADAASGWKGPLQIRSANRAAQTLLCYAERELEGQPLSFILPKDEHRAALLETLLAGSAVRSFDTHFLARGGALRPVCVSASGLTGDGPDDARCSVHEDGVCDATCAVRIDAIVIAATDTSEILRSEEDRARLASAVEHAADAIIITDGDGVIEYVNPAFENMSGWPPDDANGRKISMLRSPEQTDQMLALIDETLRRGKPWRGRITNLHRDGSTYEVDAAISPVRDPSGRTVNYVTVHHDVSHEMALESQLRQAQKMEAIGSLAGGVAHDFNNLLSVVNGYAKLLLDELPQDSLQVDYAGEIQRAGMRATGLTRQLLAFSRRQVLKPRVLDLNEVVRDMQNMLRRLIGEDVELRTELRPAIGMIEADPGQVEQVIMNLVVNARDAMLTGGQLTIETSNSLVTGEYALHRPELSPGPYVVLSITDSGCGMDPETLTRIFEPFFTTKGHGQGTGLGLSTVYGIVKQSGGHVAVYSEEGHGTTFRIYFAQVHKRNEEETTASVFPTPGDGTETVLIAEDEPGVRKLAVLLLRRRGYTVLEADDGEQALQVAKDHTGPIELLLTDVVMPRMSGRALYDALARKRPETAVLYMSGYTDSAIVHHGVLEPGTPFIEKPFPPDQLLAMVRAILDGDRIGAGLD